MLSTYIFGKFQDFNYMNNIDRTKKIQFPMEAANQEFLDLTLTFDKESKRISVDIFARAYNNFICVLPSICFPKTNTEYIPKAVALPF